MKSFILCKTIIFKYISLHFCTFGSLDNNFFDYYFSHFIISDPRTLYLHPTIILLYCYYYYCYQKMNKTIFDCRSKHSKFIPHTMYDVHEACIWMKPPEHRIVKIHTQKRKIVGQFYANQIFGHLQWSYTWHHISHVFVHFFFFNSFVAPEFICLDWLYVNL